MDIRQQRQLKSLSDLLNKQYTKDYEFLSMWARLSYKNTDKDLKNLLTDLETINETFPIIGSGYRNLSNSDKINKLFGTKELLFNSYFKFHCLIALYKEVNINLDILHSFSEYSDIVKLIISYEIRMFTTKILNRGVSN